MRSTARFLGFMLLLSSVAHAQNDWEAVKALSPGTRLRIQIQDHGRNHRIEGRLESIGDAEVTVVAGRRAVPLERQSIQQIARETGRRLVRHKARNGCLVGIAAAIVWAIPDGARVARFSFAALSWGPLGALIGAIDGASDREFVTVYRTSRLLTGKEVEP
jgi:hypothetical protein